LLFANWFSVVFLHVVQDRVAIHEAMEQQTISIAKAGITTILNSRTSVLAAANPSFGRYDDMKTAAEQIDFQTTILSRFDLIFVVKDSRVEVKDKRMAKHIMNLHMGIETAEQVGDIDVPVLKRYIEYCRTRVSPRLTVDACESLRNQFVSIRNEHRLKIREGSVIPITIRQLEAIVRLSESVARMSCTPDVTDAHVAEAFRLFRVSTLDAASTGLEIDGSAANDPNFVTKVRCTAPLAVRCIALITLRHRSQRLKSGSAGAWPSALLFLNAFLWRRPIVRFDSFAHFFEHVFISSLQP
jgi:DNA replication licensing factor MCM5